MLYLELLSAELETDCILKGESPTVESAFELENIIDGICVDANGGLSVVHGGGKGVLGVVGLLENKLEVTAVSLLEPAPFVLLCFVKLAKKSNDDGCALLNPPNPLNALFLD